ncbi:hypothetical protein CRE_05837 [Caenorhabditis remanei]|uniref:C-type lectin domain-containing protein n=1 Tax=Caenorhabditis remanei TaxID=31234 RepID=E3MNL8_CAERE|nr:hypothetical protein CRE_05837 [Caenorhabditis remanei]
MLKILVFSILFGFSTARIYKPLASDPYPTPSPYPWYTTATTLYPWYYYTTTRDTRPTTTRRYDMWTTTRPPTTSLPPIVCPDGYTVLNGAQCVKLVQTPMTYTNALNYCRQNVTGGNLVSIRNAIDNRALTNLAKSMGQTQPVWIGLTCSLSGSPSSCYWADDSGSAYSYSNFASGNPFVDVGQKVYMLISGGSAGKWVSGDGDLMSIDFFCEAEPKNQPEPCFNSFNGYCYDIHFTPETSVFSSRSICESSCGDMVSIHSSAENNHILSIYNQYPSNYYSGDYLRIGGISDSVGKYWLDGTDWDYSNLEYFNPQIGSCMTMAVKDDIVPRGTWMSNNCAVNIGFVCKRKMGATC